MRYFVAIAAFCLACFSVALGWAHPSADAWVCRAGLCPIAPASSEVASSSSAGAPPASFLSRINEDASDPYLWSDYAESLAASGDAAKAEAAFERAVSAGPHLPAVLIRAAYFDFTHDEFERGAAFSNRVLAETDAFDPLVFSYLQYFGQGTAEAAELGVPAAARPARAWAAWVAAHGSEAEIMEASGWMRRRRLLDSGAALNLTWSLWRRQFFISARELWSDWTWDSAIQERSGGGSPGQVLSNSQFEREPDGSPFDWSIPRSGAGVAITRGSGLTVQFLGTANVNLDGIEQSAVVTPGRYHFSAVIASDGLTTDQRPFFRIFDAVDPERLDVRLPPVAVTAAKGEIACDLEVPRGTETVTVELVRRPSARFDNRIQGTLRVYGVSLVAHPYKD